MMASFGVDDDPVVRTAPLGVVTGCPSSLCCVGRVDADLPHRLGSGDVGVRVHLSQSLRRKWRWSPVRLRSRILRSLSSRFAFMWSVIDFPSTIARVAQLSA